VHGHEPASKTHFLMMYQHPDFSRYDVSSLKKGWASAAEVVEVSMIRWA